jgi:putative FmdB family regulatory protein
MPTYEYACASCEHRWEALQKISEDPLDSCPKCEAKTAKRLISGGSFILKGGGWYADAYSSSSNTSPKTAPAAGGSAAPAASASTDSASPAKVDAPAPPAAKAPAKSDS